MHNPGIITLPPILCSPIKQKAYMNDPRLKGIGFQDVYLEGPRLRDTKLHATFPSVQQHPRLGDTRHYVRGLEVLP